MPKLLDAVTVDTDGAAFELLMGRRGRINQRHSLYAFSSSFGGGVVTIEVSPDNGSKWFTARLGNGGLATFAASDVLTVFLQGTQVRATLTGATSPSALTVIMI